MLNRAGTWVTREPYVTQRSTVIGHLLGHVEVEELQLNTLRRHEEQGTDLVNEVSKERQTIYRLGDLCVVVDDDSTNKSTGRSDPDGPAK